VTSTRSRLAPRHATRLATGERLLGRHALRLVAKARNIVTSGALGEMRQVAMEMLRRRQSRAARRKAVVGTLVFGLSAVRIVDSELKSVKSRAQQMMNDTVWLRFRQHGSIAGPRMIVVGAHRIGAHAQAVAELAFAPGRSSAARPQLQEAKLVQYKRLTPLKAAKKLRHACG